MEDILQFLFITGLIIIGIVRQFREESKKNADKQFDIPLPEEEEIDEDATPVPQSWGRPYVGHITEKQPPKKVSASVAPPKRVSPPSPPALQTPDSNPDYSIHSAEEARKAIIWSEILRNKWITER